MSKKFPDFKSDDEADAWLQGADLTEYDLSDMKKVRFELARKDASISLRLPHSGRSPVAARSEQSQGGHRSLDEGRRAERRIAQMVRTRPRSLAGVPAPRRYREELRQHPDLLDEIRGLARERPVTLVFGAHDEQHNDAAVLKEVLTEGREER